ncbi:MAG TPA: c-type cytochrome biogenesis protein CcsB, partial [Paraburkholderia sp.]|nr:c-type cytochrome biogenesis protein CcsB [Paraburkholderia sp.]
MDLSQVSPSANARRAERAAVARDASDAHDPLADTLFDERPLLRRLTVVDWLFALALVAGAGFALSRYHAHMNYYD